MRWEKRRDAGTTKKPFCFNLYIFIPISKHVNVDIAEENKLKY